MKNQAKRVVKRKTTPRKTTAEATKTRKRQGHTIVAKNTNPERRAPYTVIMEERFEDISKPKKP